MIGLVLDSSVLVILLADLLLCCFLLGSSVAWFFCYLVLLLLGVLLLDSFVTVIPSDQKPDTKNQKNPLVLSCYICIDMFCLHACFACMFC